MRLLHTSDWHLGRNFHGAYLLQEQEAALARIVELARDRHVEVVIIAGDLYERTIPPAEAVKLFTDILAQLARNGATVAALGEQFLRKVSCGCPLASRTEIGASDAHWLFHAGGRLDGFPPFQHRYRQDPLPLRAEAPLL